MSGPLKQHDRDELVDLLYGLQEETLDAPQVERLESLVLESDDARKFYVEWMNLRASLYRRLTGHDELEASEEADTLVETPSPLPRATWRAVRDFANNHLVLSMLVSAILMANLLLVLALILPDIQPPKPDPVPSLREYVAEITNGDEAVWDQASDGNFKFTSLLPGDRLLLKSGRAEVSYFTGAKVTFEGPAELLIGTSQPKSNSDFINAGWLKLGTLVAICETPGSQGFAMETPQATFVDLGTQFAVVVHADQSVTTHVLEGEVELRRGEARDRLTAGHTATISSAGSAAFETSEPQQLREQFAQLSISPPPVFTQVVNVDLGHSAGVAYVGYGAAPDRSGNIHWNVFSRGQRQSARLTASDGTTPTTIGFNSGAAEAGQLPEQRIDLLDDYHFHWTANGPFTLTLTGLKPDHAYDLFLYASSAYDQGTKFTIGEETKATDGTMIGRLAEGINYVRFKAIAPDANGVIMITAANNGKGATMLNGFQIAERESESGSGP